MCIKNDIWILQHSQIINPFNMEQVNPASYDLQVDKDFVNLLSDEGFDIHHLGKLRLMKGSTVLASTVEYIKMPIDVAGTIYLKSNLARQGLDHALAGWVDPGFEGQITLELHAHRDIILSPGQCIVQLVFHGMEHPSDEPYQGRYQYQVGPTEAREEVAYPIEE
jgi:dCTP deaminase